MCAHKNISHSRIRKNRRDHFCVPKKFKKNWSPVPHATKLGIIWKVLTTLDYRLYPYH